MRLFRPSRRPSARCASAGTCRDPPQAWIGEDVRAQQTVPHERARTPLVRQPRPNQVVPREKRRPVNLVHDIRRCPMGKARNQVNIIAGKGMNYCVWPQIK